MVVQVTTRRLLGLALAFASCTAFAAEIQFTGRPAQDVLRELGDQGVRLIYSSDLVRPRMQFQAEPPSGLVLERLRSALAEHGLALKRFEVADSWLIVRAPKLEQPSRPVLADDGGASKPVMEEVVVTSSRHVLRRHEQLSRHSLAADELAAVPEVGDDALRAVNHVPGTASLGVSARPHIRGGARDEVLVRFNDIELQEPYHLKDYESLFSTFNPALIERIDVYTGGFPARYGDRMSGVMDIQPVSAFPEFGAELTLSALTTAAAVYGQKQGNQWALSGRRGNLDLLTDLVNPDVGKPRYSDWMGQLTLDLDERTDLDVGFLVFQDDVELKDLEDGQGELARSRSKNAYAWAKLGQRFGDNLDVLSTVSFGQISRDRGGFSRDSAADESSGIVDDRRRFRLASMTQSFDYRAGRWSYEFGWRANYQRASYRYFAEATLGDLAVLIGTPQTLARRLERQPRGWSGGSFVSASTQRGPWHVQLGARWDFQNYARDSSDHFSPRFHLAYEMSERTRVTVAGGRYYQSEAITELQIADGALRFESPQNADQAVVGLHHRFSHPGWQLRLEAFFKRVNNPKARYENLFNNLVLLPEIKPDRIRIAPTVAYARGVEATLTYNPNPDVSFWLSYTGSRTFDREDGVTTRRAWDQAHAANAGLVWNRGPYSVSAALRWHSGWRTTALPEVLEEIDGIALRRNADELKSYFSLDLRASRTWQWSHHSLSAFLEVTNLTGRDNVGGFEFELEELDEGGFAVRGDERTLLPLVPSIGFQWKFH